MQSAKLRKFLLPIGLLVIAAGYLLSRFNPSMSNLGDFIIGLGAAFVLSALFFALKAKPGH